MQKLAKDGSIADNQWSVIEKDASVELNDLESGFWLIHASAFSAHIESLGPKENVGIWIDSEDDVESLQTQIEFTSVIAINFPIFADGRGFSLAQALREELQYKGEICAIGNFMEEQLFYLKRCGFDSFIIPDGADIDALKLILEDFSDNYQGSSIEPKPLYRRKQL